MREYVILRAGLRLKHCNMFGPVVHPRPRAVNALEAVGFRGLQPFERMVIGISGQLSG